MAQARRAAADSPEVLVHSDAPRRGRNLGVRAVVGKALAPTAVVLLLAVTTTLTFVPMGGEQETSAADPAVAIDARTTYRNSREFARTAVPTPSATAVAVVPSMTLSPTSSTAAAPAEGTPTTSPVASASPVVPVAAAPVVPAEAPPVAAAAPAPESPAVDWSIEGDEAGTRWAATSVNVRSGPGTDHDVVTAFAEGRKVTITDTKHEGWQQVSLRDGAGWVKASYLTDEEPKAPVVKATEKKATEKKATSKKSTATSETSESTSAPAESVSDSAGTCPRAGKAENGMRSRTVSVLRKVCAAFPSISSYGGYRAGSSGYHGSGRAIDAMISGESGWAVANWARANASSLGVVEVIYQQKIWTKQRSGDGWRSMSSRGSATANHFDHVHISVG